MANNYDAIVFTVKHSKFKDIDFKSWLNNFKGIIIDANHILSDNKIAELSNIGIKKKQFAEETCEDSHNRWCWIYRLSFSQT